MSATRIACVADDSSKATAALKYIEKHYEVVEITKRRMNAHVIVVLGGDGFMLQTLHKYMKMRLPFYGVNCGTVGFLMNQYVLDDLAERIRHARPATLYPLHMYAGAGFQRSIVVPPGQAGRQDTCNHRPRDPP